MQWKMARPSRFADGFNRWALRHGFPALLKVAPRLPRWFNLLGARFVITVVMGFYHPPKRAIVLPRCSDPDDQKFLTLALDAAADWLLTRDKVLLNLNRRLKTAGFRVVSPSDWSAECGQPTDAFQSNQVADSASVARSVR